jgi:hypothetical protein
MFYNFVISIDSKLKLLKKRGNMSENLKEYTAAIHQQIFVQDQIDRQRLLKLGMLKQVGKKTLRLFSN